MKKIIKLVIAAAVLVWIGMFIYGFAIAIIDDSKDYPGKSEFKEANSKITTAGDGTFYGNSQQAEWLARDFSSQMKSMQDAMFSGGSGKSYASGGNFITYCQMEDSGVALIVHVPELRNYEGEVLDALVELAWHVAQANLSEMNERKLIVGLRGFASYGPVIEGTTKSERYERTDGPYEDKRIYPYFPEIDGSTDSET